VASNKAFQDEINAYKVLAKRLKDVGTAFQEPAGADAGFPDFGFTVNIGTKAIDCHIEYKNSHTAQMGSMRDWRFDNKEFSTPDVNSEQKQELIAYMNATPSAKKEAKRLLKDLKTYFHKDVKEIYSGCLSIVKDKGTRHALAHNFAENTRDYQIANIANAQMGDKIITHYKNKFKKVMVKGRAKGHVLMMMIKDELWYVDTAGSVTKSDLATLATMFGATELKKMKSLTAALEVRIQPRGLTNPNKPASIDVMASFRLKGKPTGGAKIL
jgi:hypothetical protein